MDKKIINVFSNNTDISAKTKKILTQKLIDQGFTVSEVFDHEGELLICIGGDGAFLEAMHNHDFPAMPIIGINTGHLGFFQEIYPDQLDDFIKKYKSGRYVLQPLSTVQAEINHKEGKTVLRGLNEIVISGKDSYSVHLNISIGTSFIEKFSGDGILVATPAGSTAYNYSLGGAIVDPRIKLLQVTPMAPMNTTAFRSFTSSLLLPSDMPLWLIPQPDRRESMVVINDGIQNEYSGVTSINIKFSSTIVNLMRFESYDFWEKVKTKFL